MAYYTYQMRCRDGSLYAGIATDLKRRMEEHASKDPKCAKYTRSHPPVALCAAWESSGRAEASRLEYRLKHLPKDRKEFLAAGGDLSAVFDAEFSAQYRPVEESECRVCASVFGE